MPGTTTEIIWRGIPDMTNDEAGKDYNENKNQILRGTTDKANDQNENDGIDEEHWISEVMTYDWFRFFVKERAREDKICR